MPYSTKFEKIYRKNVNQFCQELLRKASPEAYCGVPKPFLPMCGKEYRFALKKIGFVGIETLGWGSLENFLKIYSENTYDFQWDRENFQNFDFLNWGVNKRYEFWHFWLLILSLVYGIQLKDLQQGKMNLLLDSFAWGNCNSIETARSKNIIKAKQEGKLGAEYQYAKKKSEELFDHLDMMDDVFGMDAVIVACMDCWRFLGPRENYYEYPSGCRNVKVYKKKQGKLLVFQCNHPHGTIKIGGPEENAREIRNLLQKYKLFCPLPNVVRNGLSNNAKMILVERLHDLREEKGNGSVFEAIAIVAKELHNQHSCMRATTLCELLNEAGFHNQSNKQYTGNARGPCSLVRFAYRCYESEDPGIAEDIAVSFTRKNGLYAYG